MEKKTDSTDFIGARIEPNLKKQFETAAKKDDRSISSALVIAMRDYITKIKEKSV